MLVWAIGSQIFWCQDCFIFLNYILKLLRTPKSFCFDCYIYKSFPFEKLKPKKKKYWLHVQPCWNNRDLIYPSWNHQTIKCMKKYSFRTLDNRQQRTVVEKMRSVFRISRASSSVSRLQGRAGEHQWSWKAPHVEETEPRVQRNQWTNVARDWGTGESCAEK